MKKFANIQIDYRSVGNVIGNLLIVESALMLIPLAVCLGYDEKEWPVFLCSLVASLVVGTGLIYLGGGWRYKIRMNRREGYLLTTLIWIVYSLSGMLPFMFMSQPLGFTDAFFETISGFTTTGATVIGDVESLGHGILLWRSLIQWVGGLGIVIFMLVVLPALNQSGSIPLFNAEVSGITHDKLHPRIGQTAKSLLYVYILLTVVLSALLWCGPMNLFDSICQAMTTMSTGGFSTRNAGIAAWESGYVGWVITVFMLLGGVNFMMLYGLSKGNWRQMLRNNVFKAYCLAVAVSWMAFVIIRFTQGNYGSVSGNLLESLFQVATAITSTGFSYGNYEAWGNVALCIIMLLMVMGACAGSTSGGVKIDRFVAIWKNMRKSIEQVLYPHHTVTVEINGHSFEESHFSKLLSFFTIYIALIVGGTIAICCFGYTFTDSMFAVSSCIGNNGLGYGATGAGGGFGTLPDLVKWLCCLLMLVGRLEVFTVMVIFSRKFWHR